MDILGNVVEETGLGQELGEPDRVCLPVPGSLTPSAADPEHIGQVLLTMLDEDGTPLTLNPQCAEPRVAGAATARLVPGGSGRAGVLSHRSAARRGGRFAAAMRARHPGAQHPKPVYSVDNLNHFAEVLNDIDVLAKLQGLPADGAVAEASPGQFEVNLRHTDDILLACDHALALKRLVRLVAENHDMHATFMAKPYEDYAGSGMRARQYAGRGGQQPVRRRRRRDSPLLKQALAGMITLMPASMALLAPNVNAYRRFQPGMYVPIQAAWGHNNRTVALRIPCGEPENHRVEYRVAGADANPIW